MSDKLISKDSEWIMGIDEAGRGPVLGAMLYGACICPKSKLTALKETGVFDSKQLTDKKRRELFEMIKSSEYLEWIIDAIPADWMSESMIQQNRYSLNEISHESAMNLIQITLDQGFNLKHVYLDTVGPPESYEQKLLSRFMGYDVKFTVSKKADALYPVVSAASICAKVTRDNILTDWKWIEPHLQELNDKNTKITDNDDDDIDIDKENEDEKEDDCWLGNGYPGDDQTKAFMQEYYDKIFGYPSIVRFSWQTAKTILDERCAKVSFSDETATNNLKKWGFSSAAKVKRSKFYRDNNLDLCFENPF